MLTKARQILVIEDNPTNLELLMFLLRASGHVPVAARDGVTGLQRAIDLMPDLIICDIQLPTIDGYEVARRIKSHEQLQDISLIAVTACAMPADRDRALAAGFDGYISKPITPYTFCDEIARYLDEGTKAHWREATESSEFSVLDSGSHSTVCTENAELTTQNSGLLSAFGSSPEILLAEHSNLNLSVLAAVLEPMQRPYTVARTVGEALDVLRTGQPSMLIAELELPGGGAKLLVQPDDRTAGRCRFPSLVLVTAGADEEAVAPLQRQEHCELMHWPIDPAALLQWIETHDAVTLNPDAGVCSR